MTTSHHQLLLSHLENLSVRNTTPEDVQFVLDYLSDNGINVPRHGVIAVETKLFHYQVTLNNKLVAQISKKQLRS